MFWSIFLNSVALILVIMVSGWGISKFASKQIPKASDETSEGEK